jgi:hypothetical protein
MYWQPRRFHKLADLPDEKLLPELEVGLGLVGENTARIASAASRLAEMGNGRPAKILASQAHEEAGKFLILMDAARCPRAHLQTHLKRAKDHLSRLLYAETVRLFPATFKELVRYLDSNRKSHYLDGPEGGAWVFRNSLLYWREQAMYVDYVENEEGSCSWQDPDYFEKLEGTAGLVAGPHLFATDLAVDFLSAGFHRAAALATIADRWRTFVPADNTHISEVRAVTDGTLEDLRERGLLHADEATWGRIAERWTFPLWSVETSEKKVTLPELLEARKGWMAW